MTLHDIPQPGEEEISELKEADRQRMDKHLSAAVSERLERVKASDICGKAVASRIGHDCVPVPESIAELE